MSIFVAEGTVRHQIAPVGTAAAEVVRSERTPFVVDVSSRWMLVAPHVPQPASELSLIVNGLMKTTGWSSRVLASVARTSHPTIQSIKRGREPERRPDIVDALIKTADVVARLTQLVGADQDKLRSVLKTSGSSGETPIMLLAQGAYGKAYLEAMDLLGRRREVGKLLNTTRVRRPSLDLRRIDGDTDGDGD